MIFTKVYEALMMDDVRIWLRICSDPSGTIMVLSFLLEVVMVRESCPQRTPSIKR